MKRFVIPALLVAASVAVYLPTLKFDFVMDDGRQIEMMESRFTWPQIPSYFTTDVWSYVDSRTANYYRPIFVVWMMLTYQLVGLSHPLWHASAILAHAGATLLLYFLARRLIGDRVAAGVAALIFAVDPVHLEGIAWVSGATEPLCAVLFFATLLSFVASRQAGTSPRARWWRMAAVTMFTLAVFAKETSAVLPLLIFAYAWLFPETFPQTTPESLPEPAASESKESNESNGSNIDMRGDTRGEMRGDTRGKRTKAAFFAAIPYLQVLIVYLGMRWLALGGFSPRVGYWSLKSLIATLPAAAWFYMRDLLWPLHLSIFPPVAAVRHPGMENFVLPAIAAAIGIGALLWISLRSPLAAFCSMILAVPLLPVFNLRAFPPEDFVHDRYLYIPSAGFCLLLGLAFRFVFPGTFRNRAGSWRIAAQAALVAPLIAILGFLTIRESRPWTDSMTLANHAVAVAPASFQAQGLLASALMLQDRYGEALPWFERSLAVHPESVAVHLSVALCHLKMGNWSQAASQLRIVLTGMPNSPQAHLFLFLGMAELELGQMDDAEAHMREAVRLRPQTSVQYRGYRYYLADLLERKGDLKGALDEYNRELDEYPDESWVLDRALALKKRMADSKN